MSREPIEDYSADHETLVRFKGPALFLSASVPYVRVSGTPEQLAANQRYLPPLPAEIREAVVQIARFAFRRDVQLILGGHPAITPLVLSTTNALPSSPNPRLIVFQSAYFRRVIPQTTVDLCNWDNGLLVWTKSVGPPRDPAQPEDPTQREASLLLMRQAMVRVSTLVGATFVGGMDGVEKEAELFRTQQRNLPRYALPNTSGAAKILFDGDRRSFAGTLADPGELENPVTSLVVQAIFEDLGLP